MDLIKQAANIGIRHIRDWLPGGKTEGNEYTVLNPKRPDKTLGSFKINLLTGAWSDFATSDRGGDTVSLYAYLNDLKQIEAAKEILKKYSSYSEKPKFKIVYPLSDFIDTPDFTRKWFINTYGKYIANWLYVDKAGQGLFYVVRYEKNGKKNILPFVYTDENKWRSKHFPNPPLYNRYEIEIYQEKDVLLVEGEKCAEAARAILKDMVVTTWCGGSSPGAMDKTDWMPIKKRRVYYWYDDDEPGKKTIKTFTFNKLIDNLIVVHPPPESKSNGWDIADAIAEGFNEVTLSGHIYSHDKIEKPGMQTVENGHFPFKCLGYNKGFIYFMSDSTEQIYTVKQGSLTKSDLQYLAPLETWQDIYGEPTKRGQVIHWDFAIDEVYKRSAESGIFNPDILRGRGAYFDDNKIIIHTGKKIICDDKEFEIKDFKSKYTYEKLLEMNFDIGEIANEFETEEVLNCIKSLSIKTELQKMCLAGWGVLAPFCGALEWRPHIWITGSSGTGKSTTLKMILYNMVGEFSIRTNAESSAAGLRQFAGHDRIPVLIDEAEPSDGLNEILKLIRSSSSYAMGEKTYKGTQNHTGVSFVNQMMFCLSSVISSISKKADESRFTFINFYLDNKLNWNELECQIYETFTEERCKRIRGRTLSLLPVIRENIKVFSTAATFILKNQRAGDQIGPLIAGALSLETDKIFSLEAAKDYLMNKNITESIDTENCTDEMRCFNKIMQSRIDYKKESTTIMNLIHIAADMSDETNYVEITGAQNELLKYGIKYEKEKIYIATKYEWIEQMLRNTEFFYNYGKILGRLEFVKNKKNIKFGTYYKGNALEINVSDIIGEKNSFEEDILI